MSKRRKAQLTKEEQKTYTEAFMDLDKDRNGWLSREEVGDWMKGTGYTLTEQQIESIFRKIDANADGRISLEEFYTFMQVVNNPPDKTPDLRKVFSAMDTNGDGQLSEDEFYKGLQNCGYTFNREQVRKLVANLEKNKKGHISVDEFLAAFSN